MAFLILKMISNAKNYMYNLGLKYINLTKLQKHHKKNKIINFVNL